MERTCGGDLLGDLHGDLTVVMSRNKCENLHRNLYLRSKDTLPTSDILSGKNVRTWVSMDFT